MKFIKNSEVIFAMLYTVFGTETPSIDWPVASSLTGEEHILQQNPAGATNVGAAEQRIVLKDLSVGNTSGAGVPTTPTAAQLNSIYTDTATGNKYLIGFDGSVTLISCPPKVTTFESSDSINVSDPLNAGNHIHMSGDTLTITNPSADKPAVYEAMLSIELDTNASGWRDTRAAVDLIASFDSAPAVMLKRITMRSNNDGSTIVSNKKITGTLAAGQSITLQIGADYNVSAPSTPEALFLALSSFIDGTVTVSS